MDSEIIEFIDTFNGGRLWVFVFHYFINWQGKRYEQLEVGWAETYDYILFPKQIVHTPLLPALGSETKWCLISAH